MQRKLLAAFMVLGLALLLSVPAQAGPTLQRILERGEVRVGLTPDNPPLAMKTADGLIMGYDVDLAQMIAKAMGVKLAVMPMSFHELLPALKENRLDLVISGMTITPERNTQFMFVGPYLISGQAILAHEDVAKRLRGPADLNKPDMVIAAARGTTSAQAVKDLAPRAQYLELDSQDQALQALLSGQAQALVAEHSFCVVTALRYRDQGLISLDKPFTYEPLGVALADDPHLANWLGNFLQMLSGSGRMDALAQHWFKDPSWLRLLPTERAL